MKKEHLDKKRERFFNLVGENYYPDDLELVKLAYDFAATAHQSQTRMSGEPYIVHPLATAQKLAELNLDVPTIIAGLLHDIPEETEITVEQIEKDFGKEIAHLVDGITKLGKIKYRGIERYAENLRKMFVAMSDDIRVIFIKFADRIHNLKTLAALPPVKQQRIATESLEIYAPIADRLGMGQIKGEMEDLAFPYVYPQAYNWLLKIIPREYRTREKYLAQVKKLLEQELKNNHITSETVSIHGRTKHLYSLYKKLLRPDINKDISKIYDLVALRIVLPTIGDCYSTLGIIHKLYKPFPGRIKDYIAQPKPNGYQSLHTTVFADNGQIIEFQIRTTKMHEEAEFGIAAHWHYKEYQGNIDKKNTNWIKELVKWQQEIRDNEQFISSIKLDVFQNRIFVFTPKGDVIDLPEKSTPIDFAYHVHSWVGDKCVGAKINNQMVNLGAELKNGDIVEIITDKNRPGPSEDWLELTKTSMAKTKIKSAINKKKKITNLLTR
ncbi:MAG TPA: RelA/SpoT family protein [bacterium]|nr:RelA/SpoT family protein [bacterium]HNS33890.1 RelA/SpoT family protein [bacterium]HNZ73001.1 RelA/SpoT family protein [bacterium]HOH67182.1 RelA/SpoT family protein [bacterium]